jgi:hypothetical protein
VAGTLGEVRNHEHGHDAEESRRERRRGSQPPVPRALRKPTPGSTSSVRIV